jgi:hypothetical protein
VHLRYHEMHLLAAGISLRMAQQERRHSRLHEAIASVCDGHRLSHMKSRAPAEQSEVSDIPSVGMSPSRAAACRRPAFDGELAAYLK